MSNEKTVAELVGMIARKLVDFPDDVRVSETSCDYTIVIDLQVRKSDIGKIIGKKGEHAQAIRTLLIAMSGKDGKRYLFNIID